MSPAEPATLILSDTHFAHPRRRGGGITPEQLRPLWSGVERLVINGDVAELQLTDARADAARQVERLTELCERDAVELVLLSGNHDAFISDRRHLELCGGRLLVTHGDALHPAIAPWARGASSMKREMFSALDRFREEHGSDAVPDMTQRLELAQHVAHQEFVTNHSVGKRHGLAELLLRPDRVFAVLRYWRQAPDLAAAFLETLAPRVEALVFGHSHRQGVWRRRGRWIINTGSFDFPGQPRAVRLENNRLGVHRIGRRRDGLFDLTDATLFTHEFPDLGEAGEASGVPRARPRRAA